MCGIAGQLSLDNKEPVDKGLIQRMTDQLSHRGPDGDGCQVMGHVGLGHKRLSIIDVGRGGAQPMSNANGSIWITYNGEIYNYQSLREDLRKRGYVFRSESDTEVIIHLYEEFGEECLRYLKGMFAFAIWDGRHQKLFAARDRTGIKPLYYCQNGNSFLFASEIKSLFVNPSVLRGFNSRSIQTFLTYYYLPGDETVFSGVHRLLPGHKLTVLNGSVRTEQYWDLDFRTSDRWTSFDDAVEELQCLLSDTVKSHLISDVPVGVLLSGGVDSTAMLRYASMHSTRNLSTFTVGFEGEQVPDERPFARLAAERFGTHHEEITLTAKEFGDFLPNYVWHMEEPICEPPAIALHAVAKLARDNSVKVLLSGEGGDEAFAGYNKYGYLLALESAKSILGPARAILKPAMRALASMGMRSLNNYVPMVDLDPSDYYFSCTSSPFTPFNELKNQLVKSVGTADTGEYEATSVTRDLFNASRELPLLNQILRVDTKTWLPDDLLIKADKMTMATSVELRVPFLDSDLLEFAASLPTNYKIRGWPPKRILRAALKSSVPTEILDRKKVGFPVPYARWLRQELRETMHDTILERNNGLSEVFQRKGLLKLTEAHGRGENVAQEIFSLYVLETLHEQFIEGSEISKAN